MLSYFETSFVLLEQLLSKSVPVSSIHIYKFSTVNAK